MASKYNRVGILVTDFGDNEITDADYLSYIENALSKIKGQIVLFSCRVFGKNQFYTFVKHNFKYNASELQSHYQIHIPECSNYIDSYDDHRMEKKSDLTRLFGQKKDKAILFFQLSEKNKEFYKKTAHELFHVFRDKVGFDIVWLLKVRLHKGYNVMLLTMCAYDFGGDALYAIDANRVDLKKKLPIMKCEYIPISKIGWHEKHGCSQEDKTEFIWSMTKRTDDKESKSEDIDRF